MKLRSRKRRGPVEVRYNDDGTVDEIIGKRCRVHIEQMDHELWFVEIGTRKYGFFACYMSKKGKVFEERDG